MLKSRRRTNIVNNSTTSKESFCLQFTKRLNEFIISCLVHFYKTNCEPNDEALLQPPSSSSEVNPRAAAASMEVRREAWARLSRSSPTLMEYPWSINHQSLSLNPRCNFQLYMPALFRICSAPAQSTPSRPDALSVTMETSSNLVK